jgi:hypothetical protein
MQGKIAVALVAGILIGVALPYVGGRGEAQIQPAKKKSVWEYKTVQYGPVQTGPQAPWAALPDPAGALNQQAAEGWECTGSVRVSDRQQGKVYSFVLKRLKEK